MSRDINPVEEIAQTIFVVRGHKVILDCEFASLYQVTTKALNQAVRRNLERFPSDFMFRLTAAETKRLRSQTVTLNRGEYRKYLPFVFTEQGVAMLSSVLRSERAVKVNIAIMRAFVQLRSALDTNRALARKFEELDTRVGKHDEEIAAIIDAIRQLMLPEKKSQREIGFHVRETAPRYRTRGVR